MNSFQPPISSATIEQLGSTLARRVFRLREIRNITQKELSKRSRFTIERIQDIESGVETWLSSSDRQLLARALVVDPYILQEVETRSLIDPLSEGNKLELIHADIADSILTGMRELECPICGDILRCRLQEGLDMQGQVIYLPKAFCQKCPFVLK
jgi:transcriptional regulator with XRE-family HTH domain